MSGARHILINGLSISGGGGYTVGRELTRHLALARPDTLWTLVVTQDNPLHEPLRTESFPANVRLYWAPVATRGIWKRTQWERRKLPGVVKAAGARAVLQLNGMIVPRVGVPTLSHYQDPVPFWKIAQPGGWKAAVVLAVKRRAVREALKNAAAYGWTSAFLRDLVVGATGITPARSTVYSNAVPEEWVARTRAAGVESLAERKRQLVIVSNVTEHKRQHMLIEATAALRARGVKDATCRIIGRVFSPAYEARMRARVRELGLESAVTIEGGRSGAEVERALRESRCFGFMSVCESFGIPPLEAMSVGTPVVTARACAMPEVCGAAAAYAEMDEQGAFNEQVYRVMTDDVYAEDLRKRGLERVEHFRWPVTAESMAKTLDEIAA